MRKEKTITINDRGRDLTFKIREMPATRLESWIVRAGLLLAGTGLLNSGNPTTPEVGDVLQAAGRALSGDGLTALAHLDYEKAKPLLDELLACCTRVDAGIEQQLTPDIVDGIIEDIKTLFTLRKEALALNFGFFVTAGQSGTDTSLQPRRDTQQQKISVRSRR